MDEGERGGKGGGWLWDYHAGAKDGGPALPHTKVPFLPLLLLPPEEF